MFKFKESSITTELFGNISAGYPGCFGVKREPEWENYLALYTQRRRIIITDFIISLCTTRGQQTMYTKDDFQGVIILDNRGERPNRVRVLLLDENGTPQLASDCEQLCGQIIIVADQAVNADPKLFGVKAVLGEGAKGPTSMLFWDGSEQLPKLWALEARLMAKEESVVGTQPIHF